MIEALRNPPAALKVGVLRTLKGAHIVFTGILSKRRSEAVRAARRLPLSAYGVITGEHSRSRPDSPRNAVTQRHMLGGILLIFGLPLLLLAFALISGGRFV